MLNFVRKRQVLSLSSIPVVRASTVRLCSIRHHHTRPRSLLDSSDRTVSYVQRCQWSTSASRKQLATASSSGSGALEAAAQHHAPTRSEFRTISSTFTDDVVIPGPFGNPQAQPQDIERTRVLYATASLRHAKILKNELANLSTSQKDTAVEDICRPLLAGDLTALRNATIPDELRYQCALWLIMSLKNENPKLLCRMLPHLYDWMDMGHRMYIRAILMLYNSFLYKDPLGCLPQEFYHALLHHTETSTKHSLLKILPYRTLVQRCPDTEIQSKVESLGYISSRHWESSLLKCQELATKGHLVQALEEIAHIWGTPKTNVDYINTMYLFLREAEKWCNNEETVIYVIEKVTQLCQTNLRSRISARTWIHLIEFASNMRSTEGIQIITKALRNRAWVGPQVFRHLITARRHLDMAPLHPDSNHSLSECARTSDKLATFVLRSWHQYNSRAKDVEAGPLHSNRYAQLSPLYRTYFSTSVLNALGLPTARRREGDKRHRHNENGVVLSMMITNYLADHGWDLHTSLTVYRRFREMLATRPDLISKLNESDIAGVLASLLSAAVRSRQELLDLCISIATDIVKITQASKKSTLPGNYSKARLADNMPQSVSAWSFTSLLVQFTHHQRFDAAERVLEEIRRNHPCSYPFGCTFLAQAYHRAGRMEDVEDVEHRMSMSGYRRGENWGAGFDLGGEKTRRTRWIREFRLIGASSESNIIGPGL